MKKLLAALLLLPALALAQLSPPTGLLPRNNLSDVRSVATARQNLGMGLGPSVISESAVQSSVTGTTAETVLATIALPALGPNSQVWIWTDYTTVNNADVKTVSARINGVSIGSYPITGVLTASMLRKVMNRGSASSQLVTPASTAASVSTSTSGFVSGTINLSVPSTLTLTATLANAADWVYLEAETVEVRGQ